MKYKNTKMELRIMELEDTVALLSRIIHTMNQMLGNLNDITSRQTDMIANIIAALPGSDKVANFRNNLLPCPSPNPQDCGSCANDNDLMPWKKYST
jgi:uncharacterized coiled-coil protein SlyX